MKNKLVSIAIALLVAQPVIAAPKPEACPTIAGLQAGGITQAADTQMMGWMGYNEKNHFGTPEEWTFIMLGIQNAEDAEDALNQYNSAIGSLKLAEGPTQEKEKKDTWSCMYMDNLEDQGKLLALTVTPIAPPASLLRYRR